ncbi:hypothetical protein BDD12DRAFT_805376 [Trichophaea hybrida]|nr:hypothetical protein BDD12DRAFT_805376 [Trichophaea hybrida]
MGGWLGLFRGDEWAILLVCTRRTVPTASTSPFHSLHSMRRSPTHQRKELSSLRFTFLFLFNAGYLSRVLAAIFFPRLGANCFKARKRRRKKKQQSESTKPQVTLPVCIAVVLMNNLMHSKDTTTEGSLCWTNEMPPTLAAYRFILVSVFWAHLFG